MIKLNKFAYEELIAGNIAWLEKQPDCLEKEHILLILNKAVEYEYSKEKSND